MKINKKFYISKKRDTKDIVTNLLGRRLVFSVGDPRYPDFHWILKICRKRKDVAVLNKLLVHAYTSRGLFTEEAAILARLFEETVTVNEPEQVFTDTPFSEPTINNDEEVKKNLVQKIMDFFSEFNFTPSFRFINTMALVDNVPEYVANYFTIQDHQYAKEIKEKMYSVEFDSIKNSLKELTKPSSVINSRMKLYYGEPGTGKTTQALQEGSKCVVCSSDMLPADLMQNFAFEEGKAEFQKSDLWKSMEEGTSIVLDEINMLPFESLRYLQGITDGKPSIDYKGFHIDIKDGFKIIGTMNLNVGGAVMSIPAPLVDRCSEIKEFILTSDNLVSALA